MASSSAGAPMLEARLNIREASSQQHKSSQWKKDKDRFYPFLLGIAIILYILVIPSIIVEAVTENRICRETITADEYCEKTMYAGYWAGALFAIVSASCAVRVLFVRSYFQWRLWLKFNQAFVVISICAYTAMLGLNANAARVAYANLDEMAGIAEAEAKAEADNTGAIDSDSQLLIKPARCLRARLADITFFVGCTIKACIAFVLILLDLLHLFLPIVMLRCKFGIASIETATMNAEEKPLNQDIPEEDEEHRSRPEFEKITVSPQLQLQPHSASDDAADNNVSTMAQPLPGVNDIVLHILEDSTQSAQPTPAPTPTPVNYNATQQQVKQEIIVDSRLYELAKSSVFFTMLQAAYDVMFVCDTPYNPDASNWPVTVTCKRSNSSASTAVATETPKVQVLAQQDNDETHALNSLERFLQRCVEPHVQVLHVRFPLGVRDQLEQPTKRIRATVDKALSALAIRYVQASVDYAAAHVDLLVVSDALGERRADWLANKHGTDTGKQDKTQTQTGRQIAGALVAEAADTAETKAAKQAVLRAAEYAVYRHLRWLVLEVDGIFETKRIGTAFKVSSPTYPEGEAEQTACRVLVYAGQVWRAAVDFVVNSVGSELVWDGASDLAAEVQQAAGVELRGELQRKMEERRGRKIGVGDVVSTGAYELAAARILHVHAPDGRTAAYKKVEDFRIELQRTYAAVLNAATSEAPNEATDLRLALPLLSSDACRGQHSLEDSLDALLDVLINGAGGSVQRMAEIHVVDRQSEKVAKLVERMSSRRHFVRETGAANVHVLRNGARAFVYVNVEDDDGQIANLARWKNEANVKAATATAPAMATVASGTAAATTKTGVPTGAASLSTFLSPGESTQSLGAEHSTTMTSGSSMRHEGEIDTDCVSASDFVVVESQ